MKKQNHLECGNLLPLSFSNTMADRMRVGHSRRIEIQSDDKSSHSKLRFNSFPGSAWERDAPEAPPLAKRKEAEPQKAVCSQAEPGNKERAAHSLIEILVVLIIVSVLIAITVPAVQRSREAARMAQCIHNQGQLAKAVHLHITDEPYGRFPGYRAFGADGATVIGWVPQLFEYVGKSNQPQDPNEATYIELLVCPSDSGPTDTPRLNYVANGGQAGIDSPADGIFFDHAKDAKVYITKDDFRDGLTNTIMLAENLDATEWSATDEANQCILWPLVAGSEINNGVGGSENVARPSSHHPGGFVAAFADGSVKFMAASDINNDANAYDNDSVYVALLTPGGDDSGSLSGDDGSQPEPDSEPPATHVCGTPCGQAACAVPADAVAHYAFENPGDLGSSSTGANHATNHGAVWDSGGQVGGAARLDGSGVWLEPLASNGMGTDQAGSAAMWANTSVDPQNWATMLYYFHFENAVSGDAGGGELEGALYYHSPNLFDGLHDGMGAVAHTESPLAGDNSPLVTLAGEVRIPGCAASLTDGQWHHFVYTWDPGGDAVLYVDGCEQARQSFAASTAVEQAFFIQRLGRPNIAGANRNLNGLMDEVRLYTRALSACEVAALYQADGGQ